MKRLITPIAAVALILACAAGGFAWSWTDNFEGGLSAWTVESGRPMILTTTQAASATHSVTAQDKHSTPPFYGMARAKDEPLAGLNFSAKLYVSSLAGGDGFGFAEVMLVGIMPGTNGNTNWDEDADRNGSFMSFKVSRSTGTDKAITFMTRDAWNGGAPGTMHLGAGSNTVQVTGSNMLWDQWITFNVAFGASTFTASYTGADNVVHALMTNQPYAATNGWKANAIVVLGSKSYTNDSEQAWVDDISASGPDTGTVTGTVYDGPGTSTPLAGATVTATSGPSAGTSTTTLANGTYTLILAGGTYALQASKGASYNTSSVSNVVVTNGSPTPNVNFNLSSTLGTVTGTVKDAGSNPIAGATVSAPGGYSTTTQTNGTYSLSLPAATYTLTASAGAAYNSSSINNVVVTTGNTTPNVNFTLTSTLGTVTGTVYLGDSTPLGGATVSDIGATYSAVTAGNGTYSLPLPAGTYTLQASHPSYCGLPRRTGVVVTTGGTTSGVSFHLSSPGSNPNNWVDHFDTLLPDWVQGSTGFTIELETDKAYGDTGSGVQASGHKTVDADPHIAMARPTLIAIRSCAEIKAKLYLASGLPAGSYTSIYVTRLTHDNTSTDNGIGSLDDDRAGGGLAFTLSSSGGSNNYSLSGTSYAIGGNATWQGTAPVDQWVTFDLTFTDETFTAKFKGDNQSDWTTIVSNHGLWGGGGVHPYWMPNYVQVVGSNQAGSPSGVYADDVEVTSPPASTIEGTVTDGSNPIAGAAVTVTAGGTGSATTDGTGYYILYVPGGTYTLTASKGASFTTSSLSNVSVASGGHTTGQNFTLTSTLGFVTGTVKDAGGNPIPGATVASGAYSTTTLGDGTYNLPLPGGTVLVPVVYTLTASMGTLYTSASISGVNVVTGNTTANKNFTLLSTTGTVTGTAYAGPGTSTPLGGATVTATSGPSAGTTTTTADGNGTYTLTLAAGTYTLQASKDGYCGIVEVSGVGVHTGSTTSGVDFHFYSLASNQTVWSDNFESGLGNWAMGSHIMDLDTAQASSPTHSVGAHEITTSGPFCGMARASGTSAMADRIGVTASARMYLSSAATQFAMAEVVLGSVYNSGFDQDGGRNGGSIVFGVNQGTEPELSFVTHDLGVDTSHNVIVSGSSVPVDQWITFNVTFAGSGYCAAFKGDNQTDWTDLGTNVTLGSSAWKPNYVTVLGSRAWGSPQNNTIQAWVDDVTVTAPIVPSIVSGTVSGPGGPLAGATVSDGAGHSSIPTGTDGHYSLYLSAGSWTLTATLTGYVSGSVPMVVTTGQTITQDFVLGTLGVVSGSITLQSIAPAFDKSLLAIRAELRNHGSTTPLVTQIVNADTSGNYNYSFTGLLPGAYDVAFYAPRFLRLVVPATVSANTTTTANGSLVNGDTDLDNEVTTTDLSTVFKNKDQIGDN